MAQPNPMSLAIAPRFRGFTEWALGGYAMGVLASELGGSAKASLRNPPPIDQPLTVQHVGTRSVQLLDGHTLIAEAMASRLELEVPDPPSIKETRAASVSRGPPNRPRNAQTPC